jgi:uncharacterized protein YggU (UPF0235/DUF167 family)
VRVAAPPESGKANDALVELLASTLGVSRSGIEILSGHDSRDKTVVVQGLGDEEIAARFDAPVGAR